MSAERGAHTYAEIMSQPEVWAQTIETFHSHSESLKAFWGGQQPDQVIFTGCGSTYYLSQIAASLFQHSLRIPACAYPASEIALYPDLTLATGANSMLVTISRSGSTTETVQAVRVYREKAAGKVLAITCDSQSPLAQGADYNLATDAAQEKSLAQTRSFSSMTILAEAMVALLSGSGDLAQIQRLVPAARRLLGEYHDLARMLAETPFIQRFFFLGSGFLRGMASEAMLKMKEMSLAYSEAYHMLEFRHGPMSMVNHQSLVVGLLSDQAFPQEAAVLRDMQRRGARVLALAEARGSLELSTGSHFVELASGLPQGLRPVIYLPVLQLMAYYRAMAGTENPDLPADLSSVISLNESLT